MLGWKSDASECWEGTELYGELLLDAYEELELCLLGVNGCGRRAKVENCSLFIQAYSHVIANAPVRPAKSDMTVVFAVVIVIRLHA